MENERFVAAFFRGDRIIGFSRVCLNRAQQKMYLRARIPVTFSHSTIYIGLQRRGYIPTLKNETDVNGLVSCREKQNLSIVCWRRPPQAIKFSQIYSK